MTSVIAKIDELAAKVGALANATGRDIVEVFDEIIAHVEGKTPAEVKTADAPNPPAAEEQTSTK